MSRDTYDVVVIGAGGGGLAAAVRLVKGGMKTLLLEQHNRVGGYMTNFKRGRYLFEVSLHNFDGLDPEMGGNYAVMRKLGIIDRIKPIRLKTAYNAVYPGAFYTIPADPEQYQEYLIKEFPREEAGIRKFFQNMESMRTFFKLYRNLLDKSPMGALQAFAQHPTWMIPPARFSLCNAQQMLDAHFQDEKLKTLVSWLTCYGGSTPHQIPAMLLMGMWAAYHYGGFYFFEGGSHAIAQALADEFEENGGELMLSSEVTKIVVENGRAVAVRTKDEQEFHCRYVVSNASAPGTVNQLTGREHFSTKYLKKLDSYQMGATCFVVYLGVKKDYTPIFNGAHTIAISKTWVKPKDFDFMTNCHPETSDLIIANYSVVEDNVAPKGKNVIVIDCALNYEYENHWRMAEGKAAYRQLKQELADIIIKRAEEILPGLSDNIEKMETATPLTMERYTSNPRGSIIGFAFGDSFLKTIWHLPQQTPVKNLYLAGAWQMVGGQSPVLMSGLMTAEKLLAHHKKHPAG